MMNEYDESIPANWYCPLTLEVMTDPVMTVHGQNFERDAILEWLNQGNNSCPLTRKPLRPSMMVSNAALRRSINKWFRDHRSDEIVLTSCDRDESTDRVLTLLPQYHECRDSNKECKNSVVDTFRLTRKGCYENTHCSHGTENRRLRSLNLTIAM